MGPSPSWGSRCSRSPPPTPRRTVPPAQVAAPAPEAAAEPEQTAATAPEPAPAPEPAAAPQPDATPPTAVAAAPAGPAPAQDLPDTRVATPAAFTPFEAPVPAGLGQPSPEPMPPAALSPVPGLPAPEAAAPALPARVFIHYPRSSEAAAAAARDALLEAGVPQVDIVPVRFTIDRSNVRYYHDSDRAAATGLSALLGPTLPGGPPVARDFTDYPTPPASGKVEVWLAGTSDGGARSAAPRKPAAPGPAVTAPLVLQPTPPQAPPANQAEAVERILIERTVQRLLEQTQGRN